MPIIEASTHNLIHEAAGMSASRIAAYTAGTTASALAAFYSAGAYYLTKINPEFMWKNKLKYRFIFLCVLLQCPAFSPNPLHHHLASPETLENLLSSEEWQSKYPFLKTIFDETKNLEKICVNWDDNATDDEKLVI